VIVLIGLMVWRARRDLRDLGWPLRGSLIAGALVLAQAGLGGLTVEKNLAEELVAAHLCLAMLLLGTLLWIDITARRAEGSLDPHAAEQIKARSQGAFRAVRFLSIGSAVLLLAAIVAGGYIAGTEKEGADGPVIVHGAHLACGEQFPKCLDKAFPFGESRLVDIHLTHRVLVYAATLAIVALLVLLLLQGVRSWLLGAAGGLLALQLLLGALNVWLGKHATLVVAHLTTATLLWSAVLLIGMRFAWAREPVRSPSPEGRAETSTVTA
jgi:heme a synthase